jgi:hypothetical protein
MAIKLQDTHRISAATSVHSPTACTTSMPATDANSLVMNAEKSATPAYPLSRCETLVDGSSDAASSKSPTERDVPSSSPRLPAARKLALLALFCLAQFLDVFNNSALFSAIPTLRRELGFDESGATWLISAYQLTFASFLLIAGKIADVYDPSRRLRTFRCDTR